MKSSPAGGFAGEWEAKGVRIVTSEDDFYAPDRAATYTPISAEQAVRQLPTLRKLKAKTAGWLREDLTSSSTVTGSEPGLPTAVTARPTSEAQVIEVLAKNDGGPPGQGLHGQDQRSSSLVRQ